MYLFVCVYSLGGASTHISIYIHAPTHCKTAPKVDLRGASIYTYNYTYIYIYIDIVYTYLIIFVVHLPKSSMRYLWFLSRCWFGSLLSFSHSTDGPAPTNELTSGTGPKSKSGDGPTTKRVDARCYIQSYKRKDIQKNSE